MNTISLNEVKTDAKKLILDLFNLGVSVVRPKNIITNFLEISKEEIKVRDESKVYIYKDFNNIIPICIGKAAVETAMTIKNLFDNKHVKFNKGVVVVNQENYKKIDGFTCFSSGHPLPNNVGIEAAKFIEETLRKTDEKDLILIFISGGGSSLLPYPVNSLSLNEKTLVNKILIESGASINEINIVRKHLSKIKGGNLTKICYPSKVHSFILSDVVGDDLSSIASGLTVPDPSTFLDAEKILKTYKVWKKLPINARNYIKKGAKDKSLETPKKNNKIFKNSKNTIIGSNSISINKIMNNCKEKNVNVIIWKKNLEGNVKEKSKELVEYINKINFEAPVIILSGGETTVKVNGSGAGGRNQEFSLYFSFYARKIIPDLRYTFLSAGTDGRDGPTNAAGGIVDQNSYDLIINKGIDLEKELNNNNSNHVLKEINSLVIMNGTNTNVADIQILAIVK
tara:strand:- start:4242 stop:5603 length:1362 start_codon:yes stop_codon:yes gene_type:complete